METLIDEQDFQGAWNCMEEHLNNNQYIEYKHVQSLVRNVFPLEEIDHSELRGSQNEDEASTGPRRYLHLLQRFLRTSPDVEEDLYNVVLDGWARLRDLKELEATFKEMGMLASAVSFGTVIKAYGCERMYSKISAVWEDMKRRRIPANVVTYGCVLDACIKCGEIESAETFFNQMKAYNLVHKNSTILYTTLLKGFAKSKDLIKAMNLYREMLSENVPCNVVTFNSLIDVAVRCKNMEVASMVLMEMQASGIMADIITYSTLVKGFCNQLNLKKAIMVLDQARIRNLHVDEIMFNILLDGCVKVQDLASGLRLFDEMQSSGISPSCVTFSILVRLYGAVGKIDEAIELVLREMPEIWGVRPNRPVYSCLIKEWLKYEPNGGTHNIAQLLIDNTNLTQDQVMGLIKASSWKNNGNFHGNNGHGNLKQHNGNHGKGHGNGYGNGNHKNQQNQCNYGNHAINHGNHGNVIHGNDWKFNRRNENHGQNGNWNQNGNCNKNRDANGNLNGNWNEQGRNRNSNQNWKNSNGNNGNNRNGQHGHNWSSRNWNSRNWNSWRNGNQNNSQYNQNQNWNNNANYNSKIKTGNYSSNANFDPNACGPYGSPNNQQQSKTWAKSPVSTAMHSNTTTSNTSSSSSPMRSPMENGNFQLIDISGQPMGGMQHPGNGGQFTFQPIGNNMQPMNMQPLANQYGSSSNSDSNVVGNNAPVDRIIGFSENGMPIMGSGVTTSMPNNTMMMPNHINSMPNNTNSMPINMTSMQNGMGNGTQSTMQNGIMGSMPDVMQNPMNSMPNPMSAGMTSPDPLNGLSTLNSISSDSDNGLMAICNSGMNGMGMGNSGLNGMGMGMDSGMPSMGGMPMDGNNNGMNSSIVMGGMSSMSGITNVENGQITYTNGTFARLEGMTSDSMSNGPMSGNAMNCNDSGLMTSTGPMTMQPTAHLSGHEKMPIDTSMKLLGIDGFAFPAFPETYAFQPMGSGMKSMFDLRPNAFDAMLKENLDSISIDSISLSNISKEILGLHEEGAAI